MEDRVIAALEIAMKYGNNDGAHHKAWVIDQMVRALTDCPLIECLTRDASGQSVTYQQYGKSDHYRDFIAHHNQDGLYAWDEGVAP